MLGRYQPWHEGHQALKEKADERTGQTVIAVRHTQGTSEKDPLSYQEVVEFISSNGIPRPFTIKVPNITNIVYGRDVGYKIEQIDLGAEIHAISATEKRKELGI
jgi:nicotinamide mononucleotide adenylyltransferase